MENYILNYFLEILGFTPKQVFVIAVICIVIPKFFPFLNKIFAYVKKQFGCGFSISTQKCEYKSQEHDILFIFKRNKEFKYFKTKTTVAPNSFRWLTPFQDIEVYGNPPAKMAITKFCKSLDKMPNTFELSITVWYKKKYGLRKRKKKFNFTYST